MKLILRALLILTGLVLLMVIGIATFIQFTGIPQYEAQSPELTVVSTPEIVEEGARLSSMLCQHCHMSERNVLEGAQVKDIDPALGVVFSSNITQHPEAGIGTYTDGELAYLIRTGIKPDGQYTPPYMPKFPNMSDSDMNAIIAYLRSDHPTVQASAKASIPSEPTFLLKALCNFVIKPEPYPDGPVEDVDRNDPIALGEYLVNDMYHCFACHSADITQTNTLEPTKSPGYLGGGTQMRDLEGNPVITPNITFDPTGIADYSEDDFINAVMWAKKPDGNPIRYPMNPMTRLDTAEVRAMYAYIKTVPKIQNSIE